MRRPILALAMLVGCLLGCRSEDPAPAEPQDPVDQMAAELFGSRAALNDRLAALRQEALKGARSEHIELGNQKVIAISYPPQMELPPGKPDLGLLAHTAPPLGTLAAPLEKPVDFLAVDDDGTLYWGGEDGLFRLPPARDAEQLTGQQIFQLQLNPLRPEILYQTATGIHLLPTRGGMETSIPLDELPEGRACWMPDGLGTVLLFVREAVDFDASHADRIFLDVATFSLNTGLRGGVEWSPFKKYSALGTLPAARIIWGHPYEKYEIRPTTAPLLRIVGGEAEAPLTSPPEEAADLLPAASQNGELLWTRFWQYSPETGRGLFRRLPDGEETALTIRPTAALAVSPNGEHGAVVLRDEGAWAVRRFTRQEREDRPAQVAQAALDDTAFRETARAFQDRLEDLLAEALPTLAIGESAQGWILERPLKIAEMELLAERFRLAVAAHFDITLDTSPAGLQMADALLDQVAPYLEEVPGTIAPLAAFLVESLPRKATYVLDPATGSLAQDVGDLTTSDDLTYKAFNAFGAARERLAGRVSLVRAAARATEGCAYPLYVVENFRQEVALAIEDRQLSEAFPPEVVEAKLEDFLRAQQAGAQVPLLHARLVDVGRRGESPELAVLSAMRLVESVPCAAAAWQKLGLTLMEAGMAPEAVTAYEQAAALDPRNASYRVDLGDALLVLDRLEAATAEYTRAALADQTGEMAEALAQRAALLEDLRSEEHQ